MTQKLTLQELKIIIFKQQDEIELLQKQMRTVAELKFLIEEIIDKAHPSLYDKIYTDDYWCNSKVYDHQYFEKGRS